MNVVKAVSGQGMVGWSVLVLPTHMLQPVVTSQLQIWGPPHHTWHGHTPGIVTTGGDKVGLSGYQDKYRPLVLTLPPYSLTDCYALQNCF